MISTLFLLAALAAEPGEKTGSLDFAVSLQRRALGATVRITNRAAGADGTGVVIASAGPVSYILTAAHVVGDAQDVEVHTFSADREPRARAIYEGVKVIARHAGMDDVALLRLANRRDALDALPVCAPAKAPTAATVSALSVGCDPGKAPQVRLERVRRRHVQRPGEDEAGILWEGKLAPKEGWSGGPLVTAAGQVIGVASGGSHAHAYYADLDAIHRLLTEAGLGALYRNDK